MANEAVTDRQRMARLWRERAKQGLLQAVEWGRIAEERRYAVMTIRGLEIYARYATQRSAEAAIERLKAEGGRM